MNRIREFREARGLSQYDLAILMGVPAPTVGRWERGEQHPRMRNAKALARRLGVAVEELGITSAEEGD